MNAQTHDVVRFPNPRRKQIAMLARLRALLLDMEGELGRGDDDYVQSLILAAWGAAVALAGTIGIEEEEIRRLTRAGAGAGR